MKKSLLLLPLLALAACDKPNEHLPIAGAASGTTEAAPTLTAAAVPATVSAPAPKPVAAPTPAPVAAPTPAPAAAAPAAAPSGPTRTVNPDFPAAEFAGTPLPADDTIPNLDKTGKPLLEVQLPTDVEIISKGKKVTSSDSAPFVGTLDLITDGERNGADGYYVELAPTPQWVQIDLEAEKDISGVWVWHSHKQAVVYKGVVVGISNDPEFKNPTFIFNNDFDNSVGLGIGADLSYTETNHGRWMPAKSGPVKGRYVRLYTNGRYIDEMNHYVEVDIYGK